MKHEILEKFLLNKKTTLAQVIKNLQNKVQVFDEDILLVVGSLVEGLGNTKSDLDLLLITDRDVNLLPKDEHIIWIEGKCLVDIRVIERTKIDQILKKFDDWSHQGWELMQVANFSIDERTLLHRLIHCVDVSHKKNHNILTLKLPTKNNLAKLKLNLAKHNTRTIFVDMMGHKETKDYPSLVFAAHVVLNRGIEALLAAHELTNSLNKWQARLLQTLQDYDDIDFIGTPTGSGAAELIWKLFRIPKEMNKDSALKYALEVVTFTRKIFLWAEIKLFNHNFSILPIANNSISQTEKTSSLPYLDFYTDFFITNDGIYISLLNEFVEPYKLNKTELNLVLMFDGKRSIHSAAHVIYGENINQERIDYIKEFISLLNKKGFLHSEIN